MQLMLAQPKIDVDSPVMPAAAFDPPVVKPGQESTYRVTLNALETAVDWPDKIPLPETLAARPGAHGQIFSMNGALLAPRTTYNYRVRPSQAGQFTIPEFTIKVNGKTLTVPAARLEATPAPPANMSATQVLMLELPTNTIYVGQTVHARVLLPGVAGVMQSLGMMQITGQGFITDLSSVHAHVEALPIGPRGRAVNTFVYELMLTPIATGKLSMFAQGYSVGNRVMGGVILPGPANGTGPQYTLLDSDPVSVDIRPLPPGKPMAGFSGAVGEYSLDPPTISTNVLPLGEPLKLHVKVRGDGNLSRLVPPPPPRLGDWQIFPAAGENLPAQIVQAQGSVAFDFTLIPLSENLHATPPLPFSAFNPATASYDDLTIPPLPIKVLPGNLSVSDLQAVSQAHSLGSEPEPEPSLSGLVGAPGLRGGLFPIQQRLWFPLLHLLPAGALLGLWLFDRRRRFLEQNPGIVLRRRALRALRRERRLLARAAGARDSNSFADSAINAMKLAVAPFYPAEPRALVGLDVVTILPESDRSGQMGDTIRRVFSSADASRFAVKRGDTRELLDLRPEIEGVLDQLEARLCQ